MEIPRKKGKEINWKDLNRNMDWRTETAKKKRKIAEGSAVFQNKIDCPICSGSYEEFVEIYGYKYVECKSCGHIFMNPPITEEKVKQLYSGKEGSSMQDHAYINKEVFETRIKQIAQPKVSYCNSIIDRRGLWVDIGCGVGELLVAAKNTGWKVRGIESDAREVEFAKGYDLDIVQDYVTVDNTENLKDANVVSMINTLEHINKPCEFLKAVSSAVSEGTYVVVEIPRHPSLSSFVNLMFPRISYRHICPPDHLHIFTEKSLEIMLKDAGLEPVSMWEFGQDILDFILSASTNIQKGKTDFINKIASLAPELQKVIDEKSMSNVIFMVTKKIY